MLKKVGGGFLKNGDVKNTFEPHIFWKYLRSAGIKPILSNICYPVWELSLTERKPATKLQSGFDK
jgi:hypothetical protein